VRPGLDLSIDFRGPTFSLSATVVIGSGMTSTFANDAEETMRAACEAVRGRAECVVLYYMDGVWRFLKNIIVSTDGLL